MKDNYKKESEIEGLNTLITIDKLEIILKQLKKSICYIKGKNKQGTGFFCKIPYPDFFNLKPVLITNHHILEENDIKEGSKIKFTLNKDSINKEIIINNKRKIFSNKDFDITIIELNPIEDSIEQDSFLEIDPKLNCENPDNEYKRKEVYIIGNIVEYTHNLLEGVDSQGKNMTYLFSSKPEMSGSPIINLNNFKIIGIHKGDQSNKKCNLGTFLRDPIKLFYSLKNLNSENLNNQIPIKNENISQIKEFNENKELIKEKPNELKKMKTSKIENNIEKKELSNNTKVKSIKTSNDLIPKAKNRKDENKNNNEIKED